jgi:hypothetical protein
MSNFRRSFVKSSGALLGLSLGAHRLLGGVLPALSSGQRSSAGARRDLYPALLSGIL